MASMNIEALIKEKEKAVAEENYIRAAEIKSQLAGISVEELEEQKKLAVVEEDYLRAAELKKAIDLLGAEQGIVDGAKQVSTPSPVKTFFKPSVVTPAEDVSKPPLSPRKKTLTPSNSFGTASTRQSLRTPTGSKRLDPTIRGNFQQDSPDSLASRSVDSELNNNPIQSDPNLRSMMEDLQDVDNHRSFKTWRSSFLNRFEEFLDEDSAPAAQLAYTEFRKGLRQFVKLVNRVQTFVEKGDLTEERTTVKGRNSLNEMNRSLVHLIEQESMLIPSQARDEQKVGYTKFHLGAVLVRDGFQEHEQLYDCCEILKGLRDTSLAQVADRQQLDEIDNFERQRIKFHDIMADLGLLEIMLKIRELGDPEDEFVFVDLKTGAIGAVTVGSCLDKGLVHLVQSSKGKNVAYREAVTEEEDRTELLALVDEIFKK